MTPPAGSPRPAVCTAARPASAPTATRTCRTEAAAEHGLRLLRSHAGAIGEELPGPAGPGDARRAANQLLAGGAGLRPTVVDGACARRWRAARTRWSTSSARSAPGTSPPWPRWAWRWRGSTTLAWDARVAPRVPAEPRARSTTTTPSRLISSNALTLGQAALALHELRGLIDATQVVAALSLLAVDGSHEAYADAGARRAGRTAGPSRWRAGCGDLIGAADRPTPPLGRIQDPYGFRCLPQIHGPAAGRRRRAGGASSRSRSTPPPRTRCISPRGLAAYHHGGFYQAQLALALDHFRLRRHPGRPAVHRPASSTLNEPAFTRLRPFLADQEPASSGVMILEYAAGAALGDLRAFSAPASLGHAVLSRGVEEQASFASLAARQTLRACGAYRLVVGCELVAAVRALRQRDLRPDPDLPVGRALELAEAVLEPDTADRPLTDDVTAAAALLDRFTDIWRGSEA